jgi:phage portal protein BeeE
MLAKLFTSKRAGEPGALSITDWSKQFAPGAQVNYGGSSYQAYQVMPSASAPGASYYETNSVVFACEANRLLLFAEARFQFQQLRNGRPGDYFGNSALEILEEPWPGASTRDLLTQAELDVLHCGNSYWVRDMESDGKYLLRLDPAKVLILTDAAYDTEVTGARIGERVIAYGYKVDDKTVAVFEPVQVAHHKPYPDRNNRTLGMSWLSPCILDIDADQKTTAYKNQHISQGANLSYVVSFDKDVTKEQFDSFVESYRENHERPENAGKTLFLGGGADVKTVGQTWENLALKATQGAGETRIAACAGVPPVIVGLSEGLASATYSNYGQARRRLVDGTMRPLWGAFAGALQSLLVMPPSARLWYDDRDIAFLREDVKDQAEVLSANAATLNGLVAAGFEPDAAVGAVLSGDLARLNGKHTGLFSVQLQPSSDGSTPTPEPEPAEPEPEPAPSANGNGAKAPV